MFLEFGFRGPALSSFDRGTDKDRTRTALVTGASSGIGRELVVQLVRSGWTVLATARRVDRLEELAVELVEAPGRVLTLDGDLTDPAFRDRLWTEAETRLSQVDLLINNAGLGHYSRLEHQPRKAIERIIAVNIEALIDLTRLALGQMVPRRSGQIVQISSVLGFVGIPYSAVYTASKFAVHGLVKSLRYELRGSGVQVWAACPGRTRSEFAQQASEGRGVTADHGPIKGEPTERIVRAIVRKIESKRRPYLVMPSFNPAVVRFLAHWLPGPYEWVTERYAPNAFAFQVPEKQRPKATSPR